MPDFRSQWDGEGDTRGEGPEQTPHGAVAGSLSQGCRVRERRPGELGTFHSWCRARGPWARWDPLRDVVPGKVSQAPDAAGPSHHSSLPGARAQVGLRPGVRDFLGHPPGPHTVAGAQREDGCRGTRALLGWSLPCALACWPGREWWVWGASVS